MINIFELIKGRKVKSMEIWLIITLFMAGIVFVVDYLLRRKNWKDNSKEEQISLLVNMFSVGPYTFLSALGLLWGIVNDYPESSFGVLLYESTLFMGAYYFIIAFIAVIASLILRKLGITKVSILINIVALVYIIIVLFVNSIVGKIL